MKKMTTLQQCPSGYGKRPVVGIYLAYYEAYGIEGINRFRSFLYSVDPEAALIVVCNGGIFNTLRELPINVVEGDNELREFSGWASGLSYAMSIGVNLEECLAIFANDTFCHHNNFGLLSRWAFARVFRQMRGNVVRQGMAGEVWQFGEKYRIDGLSADRWVATYLFALSGGMVAKVRSMRPKSAIEDFYIPDPTKLVFSGLLSKNLAERLSSWLFGQGGAQWKNHAHANLSEKKSAQGKANSIICEKYMSAKVKALGGEIIDVFASPAVRELRRLETLYTRTLKFFTKAKPLL
jgi:hypothetical protein